MTSRDQPWILRWILFMLLAGFAGIYGSNRPLGDPLVVITFVISMVCFVLSMVTYYKAHHPDE